MISIQQAAKELNVCEKTIRNYIKNGQIKAVKIGGLYRISEEEIKRLKGE